MNETQQAVYDAAIGDGMTDAEARAFVAERFPTPLSTPVGSVGSLEPSDSLTSNIPTHITGVQRGRRTLGEALMDARNRPPVRVIVPGLITSGLTILAGMEKVGKSFISLDLAYHVALGGQALGALPCGKANSLYIALEDTTTSITNRLRLLDADESVWPLEDMEVITARDGLTHLAPEAVAWVKDSENPALLIIDTLGTYRDLRAGEDRKMARLTTYQQDVALLRPLFNFAHEHNIAVVFVHHTNQGKREEQVSWTARVSGTTGLTGTADQIIVLDGERGEKDAELKITGRNFEDNALTVRRAGPWWHVTDGLPQGRLGDRIMEVEKVVYRAELPVGPQDIAAAIDDMDSNQASVYLGRLSKAGRIMRYGRGKYGKPATN